MRKAFLFLAILGLTSSLWAADPYAGTWKLNVEKSILSPILAAYLNTASPTDMTVIVREKGDELEIAARGKRADGTEISFNGTRPKQGGITKVQPPLPEGDYYIDTVIEPGNWYWTVIKNGKQFYVMHAVISKDGKVMEWTIKGTDDKGIPYEHLEVFDRQ